MKYIYTLIAIILGQVSFAQNPSIKVLDTDFSKGRLANQQTISLNDVAKFHGHLCDGLVVGFLGLREALYKIYTDSIIDRTNTRVVSKSSPCLTDIAIYLSGGRYQFNTFYVDDSIKYAFIVQRIDNEKTYGVKLKSGVKPTVIDSLGNLANNGKLSSCLIDSLHKMENKFIEKLYESNAHEIFIVEEMSNFIWQPVLKNTFIKTDVLNKQKSNCKQ
ncbi:MAG: formylmethanofuran dehydrogenase subunit E family protein [Bacteroidota bacterium]